MRSRSVRICRWAMVAGLAVTAALLPGAGAESAGEMGGAEMAVLGELNLARTRPAEYARYVEEHKRDFKSYFVVTIDGRRVRTLEGLKAVDEAIAFLTTVNPLPALSPSRSLTLAARDHVADLGARGTTGHVGADGSRPADRIGRYGAPRTASGEVISYGPSGARSIVIRLIVDDGVPGRDHRKSIFSPDYGAAGIAIGPHRTEEHVCVVDFADQMSD